MKDSAVSSLVWFRRDLRLADHPALAEAASRGAVYAVYILDDAAAGEWQAGTASRAWLHHHLADLKRRLAERGVTLLLRRGDSETILKDVLHETGAKRVFWNRRYEPFAIAQDEHIKEVLHARGVEVRSFNGSLLCEPWDIANQSGRPYRVFTPFWKACTAFLMRHPVEAPLVVPMMRPGERDVKSDDLDDWGLRAPDAFEVHVAQVGEEAAQRRLQEFASAALAHYKTTRDIPAIDGTSSLSVYLSLGVLSPRQIVHASYEAMQRGSFAPGAVQQADHFLKELGWREFAYHQLVHAPHIIDQPLQPSFRDFPFRDDPHDLHAWQKGRTGYPLVDAGMRQLRKTGWMHNRVRMVAASFLVKHVLVSWQSGAAWFWEKLADADLANNSLGWQWVAGCGADAAPFFRIFNPVTQSEKFDSNGDYIRRYVPELRRLSAPWIHRPWQAPPDVLAEAGITLGEHYPYPIIDHNEARQRALVALQRKDIKS